METDVEKMHNSDLNVTPFSLKMNNQFYNH